MKMQLKSKWLLGIAVAVGLGLGLTKSAQAASSDTIRVSVTPSVTYAVTITSVNASGYDFGTVALNSTTQSTAAITVTNSGNVSEYFGIAISNTSGSWTPTASAPSTDNFRMGAVLNAGTQPAVSGFSDYLTTAIPGVAASLYGQTATTPTNNKKLWLKLEMPQNLATGGTGAQTMTLTVNGQAS